MANLRRVYGGVETGGTKIVCTLANHPDSVEAEARFPTTTPGENIGQIVDFFGAARDAGSLVAVGIAACGPVDLHPDSPTYGYVTSTPKIEWQYADLAGSIQAALGVPVAIDTDVNGAAIGEYTWGAGQGIENLVYVTVGTGIGVGVIINGRPLHGLVHPEGGHMWVGHDWRADPFVGACSFHGDCWEGLASGMAIRQRWNCPGERLPADHPAWYLEANYLAQGLHNLVVCLSPSRIILGGSVMLQAQLYPMVRRKLQHLLGDYVVSPAIQADMVNYVVAPGLGNRAGMMGAIAMAQTLVPAGGWARS